MIVKSKRMITIEGRETHEYLYHQLPQLTMDDLHNVIAQVGDYCLPEHVGTLIDTVEFDQYDKKVIIKHLLKSLNMSDKKIAKIESLLPGDLK